MRNVRAGQNVAENEIEKRRDCEKLPSKGRKLAVKGKLEYLLFKLSLITLSFLSFLANAQLA